LIRIRWSIPAADDLDQIKGYLEIHRPELTDATIRKIYAQAKSLKHSPGRDGTDFVRGLGNWFWHLSLMSSSIDCRMTRLRFFAFGILRGTGYRIRKRYRRE